MRILIAALLSVALILVAPAKQEHSDINNIVQKPANVEQARKPATEEIAPLQEKTPEPVKDLSEAVVKAPEPVKAPVPEPQTPPKVLTDHEKYMQAAGIKESDWNAVEYIIQHESSWRPTIRNNEGCVGLGQRCPASVLLKDCPDLDPVCQLIHFSKYAESRYGGWQSAYNAWVEKHWW